jgi:hypothetical protein
MGYSGVRERLQVAGSHGADDGATTSRPIEGSESLRLVEPPRYCASCGTEAATGDTFCTSCGHKLPPATERAGGETAELPTALPEQPDETLIAPPPPVAHFVEPARGRSSLWVAVAVLAAVALAGSIAFAVLWRLQASDAQGLRRTLHTTRLTLASTQSDLGKTKQTLAATSSESEKRRQALVRTQDVLTKVDPLLSSVDGVQQKAGALGTQGSTISSDAEAFITTVAALVNYMLQPGTNDYTYVGQQVDLANSELATIRADESLFSGDNSAYGAASTAFGTKATAFTDSVRALQRQLRGAVGRP